MVMDAEEKDDNVKNLFDEMAAAQDTEEKSIEEEKILKKYADILGFTSASEFEDLKNADGQTLSEAFFEKEKIEQRFPNFQKEPEKKMGVSQAELRQQEQLKQEPQRAKKFKKSDKAVTSKKINKIIKGNKIDKKHTKTLAKEFKKLQEAKALREVEQEQRTNIDGPPTKYEINMKPPNIPEKGESQVFLVRCDENGPIMQGGEPIIDVLLYKDGKIAGAHFPDGPGEPCYGPKTMEAANEANKTRIVDKNQKLGKKEQAKRATDSMKEKLDAKGKSSGEGIVPPPSNAKGANQGLGVS